MTDEHTKALIKYRLERAEETYNEVLLMVKRFIDEIKQHLEE